MKVKIFENEGLNFERELQEFLSKENVKVIKIHYSTAPFFPQPENGWDSALYHCAMVLYEEQEGEDIA